MRWPQPTAQYGQTERATRSAVAVRGVRVALRFDSAAAPRPMGSVPVSWRKTGQVAAAARGEPAREDTEPNQVRTPMSLPLLSDPVRAPVPWGQYPWTASQPR